MLDDVDQVVAPKWVIRESKESDRALILNSWSACVRANSRYAGVKDSVLYAKVGRLSEMLIASKRVLVAHPVGQVDTIAGWICFEHGRLYFGYTKRSFRRGGVFRSLITSAGLGAGTRLSYIPPWGDWWERKGWILDPWYYVGG